MSTVWSDWIPGVLSDDQLRSLSAQGHVTGTSEFAASAIDLHVASTCFHLTRGPVKPFGEGFLSELQKGGFVKIHPPQSDGTWLLEPRQSYLFELRERLEGLREKHIFGQATAKSSVGRVDVLARLVVDGMNHYERFNPKDVCNSAAMYLEVTPITFQVRIRPKSSLNQLRFFYGRPLDCEMDGTELCRTCLDRDELNLTVDLSDVSISGEVGCGFRAAPKNAGNSIALWRDDPPSIDPYEWWELVHRDTQNRLRIEVDKFYILRSKERLRVPPGIAVYARAIDEEIGEMRIHYAGFAHPRFGWKRPDDKTGSPLIFEVRGHSVPVNLRDGEILARLQLFRMSEIPTKRDTSYPKQELNLSAYFADWTQPPRCA